MSRKGLARNTAWQQAKPTIRSFLGNTLRPHGFTNVGVTMHRYRSDFVDMVHVCSVTGNDFALHVGCDPRNLMKGVTPSGKDACLLKPARRFWLTGTNVYSLPEDMSDVSSCLMETLVPQLERFIYDWFPLFPDIDAAINQMEKEKDTLLSGHRGCPMYPFTMFVLRRSKEPDAPPAAHWRASGLPPIPGTGPEEA